MDTCEKIVKVLEALPTSKLIDTVSKGIGKICEPWHKKKMTDARVYEINEIGEALRKNCDVLFIYENAGVSAQLSELNELAERTQHRLNYQELKKQYNIEKVVDFAYHELENKTFVSNEPVDDDWICSFFDLVANVSTEQMQILWGKILAGEITQPGGFSIRTLDVLRKLTQKEALIFKKIIPYILVCWGDKQKTYKDYFIFKGTIEEAFFDMKLSDIFMLFQAGLISMDNLIAGTDIMLDEYFVIEGLNYNIRVHNKDVKPYACLEESFILTEAGRELYSVILELGVELAGVEYFEYCKRFIKSSEAFKIKAETEEIEIKIEKRMCIYE